MRAELRLSRSRLTVTIIPKLTVHRHAGVVAEERIPEDLLALPAECEAMLDYLIALMMGADDEEQFAIDQERVASAKRDRKIKWLMREFRIRQPEIARAEPYASLPRKLRLSELDYETAKAAKRNGQPVHAATVADLATIDQHAQDAAERGADYISMRRLSELIGATTLDAYADLANLIATERPARYAPSRSIYRTTVESGSN